MNKTQYKTFQLRLPRDLHEDFFKAFPGRGERKLLLERFIELAIRRKNEKDAFIEGVLEEAKERYGEAY